MKNQGITVSEFKEYFNSKYSYIQHDQSDKQIYEYLKRANFQGTSLRIAADMFNDMLLSQGLADVQE